MKLLAKVPGDSWLGGVCSGIAYSVGVPTWIVRLLTVVLAICLGVPVLLYALLWFFMPNRKTTPADYLERTNRCFEDAKEQEA